MAELGAGKGMFGRIISELTGTEEGRVRVRVRAGSDKYLRMKMIVRMRVLS